MKDDSNNGTFVFVRGKVQNLLGKLLTTTYPESIPDSEVLATVEFIAADDSRIPQAMVADLKRIAGSAHLLGNFKCKIARWPDNTIVPLYYDATWERPRDVQIIRAYRNARHTELALKQRDGGGP